MSQSSNPDGELYRPAAPGPRLPYRTLLISAGASALVIAVAVLAAPADFRVPLLVGTVLVALLVCASLTAAVYFREETQRIRRAAATANADAAAIIAAANEATTKQAWDIKNSENRRAAAMAAFAGAAGRMQAMTTSMLAELREMEHRHADPKVLADLLELDHRTAQAGRLADSIAVLSGARTGRRWAKPIAMESILRGAMGRVAGYQRVRLRAVAEIAVAGHAAEGLMHTLAELLDNACNFSPPTTEVHVYAAEVPAGVVLTIEDSGLVMSESALRRAEQAVSGQGADQRGADLSSLTGTRLGLAVVGHLARKHGLTVSYRPSAIGGTAVVVVVPRDLTTRLERTTAPMTALTPPTTGRNRIVETPEPAPAAPEPLPVGTETTSGVVDSGLPKRRRGSTLAAVHPEGLPDTRLEPTPPPPVSRPAAFGAFQRAVAPREPNPDLSPNSNGADARPSAPSVALENEH
ncbi:ATP-binding protein [Nocardia sp. NPDC048505]|uniref:sensor histidine kinase n=1 Tax=Nocardia sp. NPDC048505 TaxID=3155756 RepID=UPI0033C5E338